MLSPKRHAGMRPDVRVVPEAGVAGRRAASQNLWCSGGWSRPPGIPHFGDVPSRWSAVHWLLRSGSFLARHPPV